MKEVIETMPRIELALIIIGVFVLISCIIFGYLFAVGIHIYLADKPLVFSGVSFGKNG